MCCRSRSCRSKSIPELAPIRPRLRGTTRSRLSLQEQELQKQEHPHIGNDKTKAERNNKIKPKYKQGLQEQEQPGIDNDNTQAKSYNRIVPDCKQALLEQELQKQEQPNFSNHKTEAEGNNKIRAKWEKVSQTLPLDFAPFTWAGPVGQKGRLTLPKLNIS